MDRAVRWTDALRLAHFVGAALMLFMVLGAAGVSPLDRYRDVRKVFAQAESELADGQFLKAQRLFVESEKKFRTILDDFPDWSSRILVEIQLNKCAAKLKQIDAFVQEQPRKKAPEQPKLTVKEPEIWDVAQPQAPEDPFMDRLRLADAALSRGDYGQARAHYEAALLIQKK